MKPFSRRKFFQAALYSCLPAGAATAAYSHFGETRWLDVHEVQIPVRPDQEDLVGTRLTVLADFHHDEWGDPLFIDEVVNRVNQEQLDFVILAG
ncbi:MAG: hypothetical protein AAF236_12440, partial [Verrucomicrobiota bacterium]